MLSSCGFARSWEGKGSWVCLEGVTVVLKWEGIYFRKEEELLWFHLWSQPQQSNPSKAGEGAPGLWCGQLREHKPAFCAAKLRLKTQLMNESTPKGWLRSSCEIQFCFLSHRSVFVTALRGAAVTKETYVAIYLILKCHLEAFEGFKCWHLNKIFLQWCFISQLHSRKILISVTSLGLAERIISVPGLSHWTAADH